MSFDGSNRVFGPTSLQHPRQQRRLPSTQKLSLDQKRQSRTFASAVEDGSDEITKLKMRLLQAERERDQALKRVETLERNLNELNDEELAAIEGLGALKRMRRSLDRSLSLLQRRSDAWARNMPRRGQLAFVAEETQSTLRIVLNLMKSGQLFDDVLPAAAANPLLMSHSLSLYARADRLEPFVPNIAPVLVDHLPTIEPHLDEIMERFDEIEPHLNYILCNVDSLAPHCGQLMKHFDELLLYADEGTAHARYFPETLPYIADFAPRLDSLASGGHLTSLRPHLPKLSRHLKQLAPLIDYVTPYPAISANADVLLFYWGWVLRVPLLRRVVQLCFRVPMVPWSVAWLASHLPKRPVRGACAGIECTLPEGSLLQPTVSLRRVVAVSWRRARRAGLGQGSIARLLRSL